MSYSSMVAAASPAAFLAPAVRPQVAAPSSVSVVRATATNGATRVDSSIAADAQPSWLAGLAAVGLGAAAASRASTERRQAGVRRRRMGRQAAASVVLPKVDRDTTKVFRKEFMRSDQYYKFGKTQMDKAMTQLRDVSGSDLVTQMRTNGNRLTVGDMTFVLAESYGMCWGVERAVAMAYEARNFFPDSTIWITNEIVHNPKINERLENDKGMKIIQLGPDGNKDYSHIVKGDVVVLPAFGATVDEMAFLKERQVQIVDTTCPWVSKVWTSVEKSKGKGCTSIIHGKYSHEETIATKSFAKKFIIVKDMVEAEYLANYLLGKGDREELMAKFVNAMSEGFDPDVDLQKVGVANQTTMLKGETELISRLFERVMIKTYGPQHINDHFVSFNTICDATQERQDAMYKMFDTEYEAPRSQLYAELEGEQVGVQLLSEQDKRKLSSKAKEDELKGASMAEEGPPAKVDMLLVFGGFNSSNTTHLVEIGEEEGVPSYHIDSLFRLGGADGGLINRIQHKPLSTSVQQAMDEEGLEVVDDFLPRGPVTIGVTSGASTPDSVVGECMQRVIEIKQAQMQGVPA